MATPYGTLPTASPLPQRKPVSLPRLAEMRERGEKITMLTAYDAMWSASWWATPSAWCARVWPAPQA